MLSFTACAMTFAIALGSAAHPVTGTAVLDSPTRHVRAAAPAVRELLKQGFEQSPTFASLMRRLERSDVIVYVEELPGLPASLEGRLIIQPPASGFRYLRVQFARRGGPSDTIAVIGHELRHAVEVAEAMDVVDPAGLAALYRRIGLEHGRNLFDTIAAQETGRRVLKELVA